jgi:uncharacterized membrane protein YccC
MPGLQCRQHKVGLILWNTYHLVTSYLRVLVIWHCYARHSVMSDMPDNLALTLLRRLDGKMDRLIDDVHDLKHRVTSVERQQGEVRVDLAGVSGRLDRIEVRIDRIERRLDLVEP